MVLMASLIYFCDFFQFWLKHSTHNWLCVLGLIVGGIGVALAILFKKGDIWLIEK